MRRAGPSLEHALTSREKVGVWGGATDVNVAG